MSSTIDSVAVPERAPPQSLWGAVREALAGAHGRDFTEGPIGRAIFILAVPMVLEMLMESIFVVVDVFVVAHLGADAVATVGLTESFMTILYTLAMGLSIGAGAMVSRRIGEKDAEGAAHTAAQVILFGCALSLLIGVVGAIFAPQLLAHHGRVARRDRERVVHARDARRERERRPAVPHQLRVPQLGGRGDGDADALAGERDQRRARPGAGVRVGSAARSSASWARRSARRSDAGRGCCTR